MKIRYFGHSCFEIQISGRNILFDPFITPNEKASHIDINSLKPDYILISHGHEDHVADAISIAKNSGAKIVSNYEIVSWFGSQGIDNGHPMNHGGNWSFDFGKLKYVNAVHSSVLPDGTYGGNPGGFIISSDEGAFYFAGDTALTMDMKLIGESFDLDFAVLPIGDNFTMGIEDAVIASDFIKCHNIIGVHYDTFGFIEINHSQAKSKFESAGKKLHLLNIGETMDI